MKDTPGIFILGGIGSGKTTASRYLEREYGVLLWSRTELMKLVCHAAVGATGSLDPLLARLFPENIELQNKIRKDLMNYALNYVPESDKKPYALYQDVTQIVLDHDILAYDRELLARIKTVKASKGERLFHVIDNISTVEGVDFFREGGYLGLELTAPLDIRRERIRRAHGSAPSPEVLFHISEQATKGLFVEWSINHVTDDPKDLYDELDLVMKDLGIEKGARDGS